MTQESIQSQEKNGQGTSRIYGGVGGRTEYCTFRNTGSDGGAKCTGSKMNTIERALQTMTHDQKLTEDVCGLLRRWNIQRSGISVISESGGGVVPGTFRTGRKCRKRNYIYIGRSGDAAQWLQNRYGWSWNKINNLAKAVFCKSSILEIMVCVDMHWYKI